MTMKELLRLLAEEQQKNDAAGIDISDGQGVAAAATAAPRLPKEEHSEKSREERIQTKKRGETLNTNLTKLNKVLEKTIKAIADNGGMGQVIANQVKNAPEAGRSKLKNVLFGANTKQDLEKYSVFNKVGKGIFGNIGAGLSLVGENKVGRALGLGTAGAAITKFGDAVASKSPTLALYDYTKRRQEKRDYIKNAIQHNPKVYAVEANFAGGMKTKAGRAIANQVAGEKYEKIKAKEAELLKIQQKIDSATSAGYTPLAKDTKSRDKAAEELTQLDPRRANASANSKDIQKSKDANASLERVPKDHTELEEQMESDKVAKGDQAKEQEQLIHSQDTIGKTLTESLEINKQILTAIKGGSNKESVLGTAADLAGSFVGKGSLLSKASGFLGKAGPGLLKGGIASLGGMALEAGGDTLKESGYEKTGGAMNALGTAASYAGTGAMIGSVIPGVGTAIGAGIGGVVGAGKGLYDNWGSIFGNKPTATAASNNPDLISASKENADIAADASNYSKNNTNIVNAPSTTINNNGSAQANQRSDIRNQDSTVNRYISSRYAM